jgi:type II secretory pathway component PulC
MSTSRIAVRSMVLTLVFAGCGAARADGSSAVRAPEGAVVASSSGATGTNTSSSGIPGRGLTRALVEQTVSQGLGTFLSRVSVSPVLRDAQFVGFRLESAEDLDAWRAAGADLRVGDVIQRINGQTIERPEQALWAFDQLRIAAGVEVVGLRGEAPFRVYSPIVDGR